MPPQAGKAEGDAETKAMGPVTELEREEMRLQVERLNDKLAASQARLGELVEQTEQVSRAFAAETSEHALKVDEYKRDEARLRADALDVERRRAALRERQASEEALLRADLEAARKYSAARAAEDDAVLASQVAQLRLVDSFEQAQSDSQQIAIATQQAHERSAAMRAELERLDAAMPTLHAAGLSGRGADTAAPLVVLELLRVLPTRRLGQREGWTALAALLATRPAEAPARLLNRAHAIGLVLTALRIHDDHAEVVAGAIGLMWKLCACDPDAAAEALSAGALQIVLDALGKHVGGEKRAPAPANASSATSSGAQSFALVASEARQARGVLQTLVYNSCGALRTLLGDAALVGRAAAAPNAPRASSGRSSSRRQRGSQAAPKEGGALASLPQIGGALGGAGGGGGGGGGGHAGGEGAKGARARRARRGSVEADKPAADGGGGAAGAAPASSIPIRSQALGLVACAMRAYPEKGALQRSAIQLLHNLVQSDARLVAECARHDAFELITRAMRTHSLQAAVQLAALHALLLLAADALALEQLRAREPLVRELCDGAEHHYAFNTEMVRVAKLLKAALPRSDDNGQLSHLARGGGFGAMPKSRLGVPLAAAERGLKSASAMRSAGAEPSFESELSGLTSVVDERAPASRDASLLGAHKQQQRQMRPALSLAHISTTAVRRSAQPARPFLLSARSPEAQPPPDSRTVAMRIDVGPGRDCEPAAPYPAEPLSRSSRLPLLETVRHAGGGSAGAAFDAPQPNSRHAAEAVGA